MLNGLFKDMRRREALMQKQVGSATEEKEVKRF